MAKTLFVTATGTDIGKTYVTALIIRKLRQHGLRAGYFKAALSGAESLEESDAGYVNRRAEIGQDPGSLVPYWFREAVSPHLAARNAGQPIDFPRVREAFQHVCARFDFVTMEGSGGIVCPIRWDETEHRLLEDVITDLGLGTVVVADAGLGTINAVVLTVEYLRQRKIPVRGVILNRWEGTGMQDDNRKMIEEIARIPVLALVPPNAVELEMKIEDLMKLYE